MSARFETFRLRNAGAPAAGLTPTFLRLSTAASPTAAITQPTIAELGHGWYGFPFDAEVSGEAVAVIDGGGSLAAADRYAFLRLSRDPGRIQAGFDAAGKVVVKSVDAAALDAVTVEAGVKLTTAVSRMAAALGGTCDASGDRLTWTYYAMGNPAVPRMISQTDADGQRVAVEFP